MIKRRCKHPTCRKLIDEYESYCDEHKTTRERQYNANRREYDPTYMSFYNSKLWRNTSKQVLLESNYLCSQCGGVAQMVDHIIPTKVDWDKRLDKENLQALCWGCHSKKTAEEKKRYPNLR